MKISRPNIILFTGIILSSSTYLIHQSLLRQSRTEHELILKKFDNESSEEDKLIREMDLEVVSYSDDNDLLKELVTAEKNLESIQKIPMGYISILILGLLSLPFAWYFFLARVREFYQAIHCKNDDN
jgi:hypothetical protein